MSQTRAVDLQILQTPPTKEELAEYRKFVEERRAQLRPQASPLAGWQQMAITSLGTLESAAKHGYGLTEQWLLELRKAAALGLAKGWGKYAEALKLAPEIGAELQALRAAVERDDGDEWCTCNTATGQRHDTQSELVWSPKHNQIAALLVCASCGQMNVRVR